MSQTVTTQLLGQTSFNGSQSTYVSPNVPAAGYYLSKKNMQTVTWNITGVSGVLAFQATLAENPTEDDWFVVHTFEANNSTQNSYQNITGNFVWIRFAINNFSAGVIQHVKVSY